MTALHETWKSISSDEEGSEMNPSVVSEMVQLIGTTLLNVIRLSREKDKAAHTELSLSKDNRKSQTDHLEKKVCHPPKATQKVGVPGTHEGPLHELKFGNEEASSDSDSASETMGE
jgi:hypothetical protein